jgi:arylsulfatase A-like enzyme
MQKIAFTLIGWWSLVSAMVVAEPARPNVIFILADDLGWSDTSLYGKTRFHQTPNIERLSQRGLTFTHAYSASPLCSPTRSAILTGLSPARTGITTPNCHLPQVVLEATVGPTGPANLKATQPKTVTRLKTEYRTLVKSLKEAGYAAGHFGKWHLGAEPYSPLEHGFDVDLPHTAGPGPAGSFVAPWKFKDFEPEAGEPHQHIEDRMAKEAVRFMEQHREEPFYLNYWMFSVHAPFDAKPELIEKHRPRVDPTDAQRSPTYAAMIESMDDAIGTLLDALDRLHLSEKTLIIFTSDNGGNMYNEVDGTTPTSNRPLRGGKATMFEGGTRVPCVMVWPGVIQPGTRSDALIQSEDYYPTLLEGLGLPRLPEQIFDGDSLFPLLQGNAVATRPIFQFFPHAPGVPDWLPPAVSVHHGDWKLIRLFHAGQDGGHRYLLFNLRDDLGETRNLAEQELARVDQMDRWIEEFLEKTAAVAPLPNAAFDPKRYRPELEGQPQTRQKAGERGPAREVAGWQFSQVTQLKVSDVGLAVESLGGDPWLSTRQVPAKAKGPFLVRLTMASHGKGQGAIYFSDRQSLGFSKEQSVAFAITHDGRPQRYEIQVPIASLTALRIDPGTGPGLIEISRLSVVDADGQEFQMVPVTQSSQKK